jgi:hypothetical protein
MSATPYRHVHVLSPRSPDPNLESAAHPSPVCPLDMHPVGPRRLERRIIRNGAPKLSTSIADTVADGRKQQGTSKRSSSQVLPVAQQ